MPKPMCLQPRDLAMLHSLGVGRYLTAVALEWLHFPSWRERYKMHYARQQQGAADAYYPLPNVYQRLRGLQAGGLVQTIVRRSDQASLAYGRLPDVFALTERGAELAVSRLAVDMNSLAVETGRQRALQNLEHGVAIGRVYAALRCASEHRQQAQLTDWQGEHVLARPQSYDRVAVRGARESLPVQPDGTALLVTSAGEQRLFLELDRGTRPMPTWHDKIAAYEAYVGSVALRTRYAAADFLLLIVAPTAQRLTRIAEEIAKVTRTPQPRYLLLVEEHVHPTTIRGYGQQIAGVQWAVRKLPQGIVEQPSVTLAPAALWPASSKEGVNGLVHRPDEAS